MQQTRVSRRYTQGRLTARVGDEQASAASKLREELAALSSAVLNFCDVHGLTSEVFPGKVGVVEVWAPESMSPQNWGEEFTVDSLKALVATLGGGGGGGSDSSRGEDSGGSGETGVRVGYGWETVSWDVLVNLSLWLEEEAGWWWRSKRERGAQRRLALRWQTPSGIALATSAAKHLAAAVTAAAEAARSLATALPSAVDAVANVPWVSAAAVVLATGVGDAVIAMGGGQKGVYDAKLKVARNATFGTAMFEVQGEGGAVDPGPVAQGERWDAVAWLVATTSAVSACAWDSSTALAAVTELRRVPAAAQSERFTRLAVRSSLSLEIAALVTVLTISSSVVDLREALHRARAAAEVAVVEERLRPPDFAALVKQASLVQASELRRVMNWAWDRRKAKKFSRRGGGGAGGRGAEDVPSSGAEEDEAAAAAAAEDAAEDLGLTVDRVKCTHEYCGVCGAPWLDDDDLEPTAAGICQVDSSTSIRSHVEGMCCGGDVPHWLSWLTVQALSGQCDPVEGHREVDFATRYDLHSFLKKF